MYRLMDNNPESGVKTHWISNIELANAIKADLDDRFSTDMVLDTVDENICGFDPGGMSMINDEEFDFNLGSITLRCAAQHFDCLVDNISQDDYPEVRTVGGIDYHKIHGRWQCICLTPDELTSLREQIANPELAMKAAESFNKRLDKLKSLQDAGVYVNAVKGDDGQIYKAPLPDKKNLN